MLKLAALALALVLTGTTTASASADPVSRVSWSSGTGTVLCLGLGSPLKPPHAGEFAVVATCSAAAADQSWDFTGGVLSPYGSSLSIAVAASGRLVLTSGAGVTLTYGPGHTLSVSTPAGPSYLAYCGTASGRYPVVGAPCGTIWYVFTQAG